MICKNHFVSRNELIITHHASKRTVYSKFKITIDFNYILSRKAVRIAKTAALKFGEFLVFFFFFLFVVSVVRPVPRSARAARISFFFFNSSYTETWSLDLRISKSSLSPGAYHLRHSGIKSLQLIILEYLTHGSHASGLSRKQRPFMFTRNRIDKFEKIEEFIWFKVWYFY